MPNGNQPSTLTERLIEKSQKTMEKDVADQTTQRLQSGQQPQQILQSLLQSLGQQVSQEDVLKQVQTLAETPVGTGERLGLIPSLIRGKGFRRPELVEELGMGKAIQILKLQQDISKSQRQIPKEQIDILNSLLDAAKKTQNPELFNMVSQLLGETADVSPDKLKKTDRFDIDPLTGELTPSSFEEKQRIQTRARAEEQLRVTQEKEQISIRKNFNTTAGLFKQLIAQLKGGIEEGGAGGLLRGFYGNVAKTFKIKGFARTAAIPGQRVETALTLNRVLTGQNRVIKGVLQMINTTLPTMQDPPNFIANKVEQSVRNAFRITKAFEKSGLTSDVLNKMSQAQLDVLDVRSLVNSIRLNPEEQVEIDAIVNDILATPATQPRQLLKPGQKPLSRTEQEMRNLSDAELQAIIGGE